jgi:hypothetical protein
MCTLIANNVLRFRITNLILLSLGRGECIPNAVSSCVEITHRIMKTILEHPQDEQGPRIDIDDLLLKYRIRWKQEGNQEQHFYNGPSMLTMLHVFQLDGVEDQVLIIF